MSEAVNFPNLPQGALLGCFGKQRFVSFGSAKAALKRMTRRREALEKGRRLEIYQCGTCGGHHIGGSAR